MNIHKEGYKIILISTLLFAGVLYGLSYLGTLSWLMALLGLPLLVLYILIVRFFRNPARHSDQTENGIVSPCDGKVVVIEEVEETEYFKDKRIQISIFMSPLNVHVNRNPVSGIFSSPPSEGSSSAFFLPKPLPKISLISPFFLIFDLLNYYFDHSK